MSRAPGARYEIPRNSHSSKSAIALYKLRGTHLAELCYSVSLMCSLSLSLYVCVFFRPLCLPQFFSSISNSVAVVALTLISFTTYFYLFNLIARIGQNVNIHDFISR